jgi:chromosomal replication initiation ATPase DnaA
VGILISHAPPAIIAAVASAFGIPLDQWRARRHTRYRQTARAVATYLMRRTGLYPWADIARGAGFNDHSTAARAAATVPARLAASPYLHDQVRALEVRLGLPISGQDHVGPRSED